MRLIYTSNPLSLVIANYEPMRFEYNGWIVSDEYACNEKYPIDSEYRIVISSQDIESKEELTEYLENFGNIKRTEKVLMYQLQETDWDFDKYDEAVIVPYFE